MRNARHSLITVISVAGGPGLAGPVPSVVVVPNDVPSVQAAIDLVAIGGAVVVAKGTYNERLDLQGKAITLRSTVPTDLFVDAANDDYRLQPGSPCIDAANNTALPFSTPADVLGDPRFVDDPATADSGLGEPPIVDMGAYEFQPVGLDCPADIDGDGEVDVTDLTSVILDWGTDGSVNGGDVTGPMPGSPPDGVVNVSNLTAVILGWGDCP